MYHEHIKAIDSVCIRLHFNFGRFELLWL